MQSAEAATPAPTYGTPASSSSPCTVPSSPNGPCRIGSTTSTWPRVAAAVDRATTRGASPRWRRGARCRRSQAPSGPLCRSPRRRSRTARDRARRPPSPPTRARSRARSNDRPRARPRERVESRDRRGLGRGLRRGVGSTKRPTKRVMIVFGSACDPPTGSCAFTMPSSVKSSVSS